MEKSYQFRVELQGIQPAIWRTFQVDQEESLFDLHEILQIVMGWENAHLFEFRIKDRRFGLLPDEDEFWDADEEVEDSEGVDLASLDLQKGDVIHYLYDFGDGWEHKIVVEEILEETTLTPVCKAGARNCPPEDVGGIFGYIHLLEVLRDPKHPEYAEITEWIDEDFDAEEFELQETNEILEEFDEWRQNILDEEE